MPSILVQQSDGRQQTIDAGTRSRVSIGRSASNDLVLTDPALSRTHAEFVREPRGWVVRDCGSRNGTLLNGERVTGPTPLSPGDVIAAGRSTILFDPPRADALQSVSLSDEPITASETRVLGPAEARRLGPPESWFEVVEEASRQLAPDRPIGALHDRVLELLCRAIRPERAALFTRDRRGEFVCACYRGPDDSGALPVSRSLARRITDEGVSLILRDVQVDPDRTPSLVGVRSLIAAPLRDQGRVIGFVYADSASESKVFDEQQLRLVTLLANISAIQIQGAALCQERLAKAEREIESRAAAEVQERLLPQSLPVIPGYEFAWSHVCCYGVGGDYCDCVSLAEGRFGVVLSDVAGHGIGAAMLMAVTQATLRTRVAAGLELDRLVAQMHQAIWPSTPANRFVSFFFAELDPRGHGLRYLNAGHTPRPLIVRRSGVVQALPAGCPPLAILPGIECAPQHTQLGSGDFLFACTDGLTETRDPDGQFFGEQRLIRLLGGLTAATAAEIRGIVESEVARFAQNAPQVDDLTLCILRRREG